MFRARSCWLEVYTHAIARRYAGRTICGLGGAKNANARSALKNEAEAGNAIARKWVN